MIGRGLYRRRATRPDFSLKQTAVASVENGSLLRGQFHSHERKEVIARRVVGNELGQQVGQRQSSPSNELFGCIREWTVRLGATEKFCDTEQRLERFIASPNCCCFRNARPERRRLVGRWVRFRASVLIPGRWGASPPELLNRRRCSEWIRPLFPRCF